MDNKELQDAINKLLTRQKTRLTLKVLPTGLEERVRSLEEKVEELTDIVSYLNRTDK